MVDRIDYQIGEDWDVDFTDWEDLEVARDNRVLMQNFALLAASRSREMRGEQLTTTKLSRFRKGLESEFRDRSYVNQFFVENVDIEGNTLYYTIVVGSDEFSETVRIP